jgi:Whirly transcription factor
MLQGDQAPTRARRCGVPRPAVGQGVIGRQIPAESTCMQVSTLNTFVHSDLFGVVLCIMLVTTPVTRPTAADYTVYKSKGAISFKVIRPTWERVPTGSGMKVSRDGTLLLEFASSRGERDYGWDEKESFGLNAVECAEILESTEAGKEASFFHDPNKMHSGEGLITKTLRLSPGRDSGYFFSLTVSTKQEGKQSQLSTPVSNAELRVIRTIMDVRHRLSHAQQPHP